MGEVGISVLLDGNLIEASGIARFTFIPTGKEYLIYTLNEKTVQDGVELNKLYVSEIGEGNAQLDMISQDDWVSIKSIMTVLSKPDAEIPNNIQLGLLSAKQYTVGPYKKIALKDEYKSGIISNQLAHQPSESSDISAVPTTSQFIEPAVETVQPAEVQTQAPVQNAFSMSATIEEQTAPTALINDSAQPVQETVPQNEAVPLPEMQPATTPTVVNTVQTVVATPQVQNSVDVNQYAKSIIEYANGDTNKVIELFKINGMELVPPETEEPPEQPGTINLNNMPVASQPIVIPTATLDEEQFVPTVPVITSDVEPVQQPTIPVTQVIEQPVVSEPTIPVTQVVPVQTVPAQPTEVVAPTVLSQPTIPVTQVVQPTQPVTNTIIQTDATTMPPNLNTQTMIQEVQNSEVNINIPEPTTTPQDLNNTAGIPVITPQSTPNVDLNNTTGIPTIVPLTAEDLQKQNAPIKVQPLPVESDKSFLADAGPVVIPVGQEQVSAEGTPGDSGQK